MSSYIGEVKIGSDFYKIGSTLYGICNSLATEANKKIILSTFDQLLDGITIHIKFNNGNTVASNVTLQFYSSDSSEQPNINLSAVPVTGDCICETNSIISFTLDDVNGTKYWRVNGSYIIEEGTNNGTIKVNGKEVSIHGLGTAAYTNSEAYATSQHTHSNYAPINNPEFTGTVTIPAVSDASANTTAATVAYVKEKTGGLSGLTGAMHFRGVATSEPSGSNEPSGISDYEGDATMTSGDVVVYQSKEYVWDGTSWRLLGDEGSYALKTSTGTATYISNTALNTLPSIDINSVEVSQVSVTTAAIDTTSYTIPNVTTAGTATTASVSEGILTITQGVDTTLGTSFSVKGINNNTTQTIPTVSVTPKTVGSASNWNAGTQAIASITSNNLTVVVPDSNNP